MTTQFKKGDNVRCTADNWTYVYKDREYEVSENQSGGYVHVFDRDGDSSRYPASSFVLVSPEQPSQEFKAGDRVICIRKASNLTEGDYTVVKAFTYSGDKRIAVEGNDNFGLGFDVSRFVMAKPVIDFDKPVQTKDGTPVTIVTIDSRSKDYPVMAYVGQQTFITNYTADGRYHFNRDAASPFDLMNVPEEMTVYVNFYADGTTGGKSYPTRALADKDAGVSRVACKRVVFIKNTFDA